jgi:arsenate reductase
MRELIKAFKALSEPTRLRIFFLLMKRDLCVCEITFVLEMSQSRVSHQLRLLKDAGLVEDRREGRWIIYTIPQSVKENLEPFVRRFAGPDLAGSELVVRDIERLAVCIRENVRRRPTMEKKTVLFICVHNSARSQMAEGLVNALYGDRFLASSGGTTATRVHPGAIKAMAEIGIDISGHRSKSIDEFEGRRFDLVVMVCDDKQADCPFFPGGKDYIHHAFDDPAACAGTDEEVLACFRRSRDEIRAWIEEALISGRRQE